MESSETSEVEMESQEWNLENEVVNHSFDALDHLININGQVDAESSTTPVSEGSNINATVGERKQWFILKVPVHVRELNDKAYSPKIVSAGPIHYKEEGLEAMESQKERFLHRLLMRTSQKNDLALERLIDAMKELEIETRNCYYEKFENIKSDDFVMMMVVDGCFIVELLRLSALSYQGEDVDDPIFATRWMVPTLCRDLMLLENQLPLFVLNQLFKLTTSAEEATCLNKLALQFFEPLRPGKDAVPIEKLNAKGTHLHLLDLFHSSFLSSDYRPPSTRKRISNNYNARSGKGWFRNAKSLKNAGFIFKIKSGDLLDIEIKSSGLNIPTLYIDDDTGSVLRNLLAYEQCNAFAAPYFTSLAVFFGSMVNTPEDVVVLQQAGIIKQEQGSDLEVVDLFTSLSRELVLDMSDSYIAKQVEKINGYCQSFRGQFLTVIRLLFRRIDLISVALFYISIVLSLSVSSYSSSTHATDAPAPYTSP